jgi:hypothetical protein
MTKILINFMSSSTWIRIQKTNLFSKILKANDVLKNINLDKLLKFDFGYKELFCIKTSPNY